MPPMRGLPLDDCGHGEGPAATHGRFSTPAEPAPRAHFQHNPGALSNALIDEEAMLDGLDEGLCSIEHKSSRLVFGPGKLQAK